MEEKEIWKDWAKTRFLYKKRCYLAFAVVSFILQCLLSIVFSPVLAVERSICPFLLSIDLMLLIHVYQVRDEHSELCLTGSNSSRKPRDASFGFSFYVNPKAQCWLSVILFSWTRFDKKGIRVVIEPNLSPDHIDWHDFH